jgi:hypothetical protein
MESMLKAIRGDLPSHQYVHWFLRALQKFILPRSQGNLRTLLLLCNRSTAIRMVE